jgi:hypothetical protein
MVETISDGEGFVASVWPSIGRGDVAHLRNLPDRKLKTGPGGKNHTAQDPSPPGRSNQGQNGPGNSPGDGR